MRDAGSFWARRRAAVEAEAQAEAEAQKAAAHKARAEALAQKDDAEVLAELGLPDPGAMQSGDDFSAFMNRDVPEHLRKQALRTLWRSNPVLACVDGLNEYDDDYRAAMLLQEPIKTAYQVGKGMLKHIEEMERQAADEDVSSDSDPEGEGLDVAGLDADEGVMSAVSRDDVPSQPDPVQTETIETADDIPPAPRRMRFRFKEAAV
ncbi:MAG: DUF3306 domain-containing protein [Pseudomonadota bacterium]